MAKVITPVSMPAFLQASKDETHKAIEWVKAGLGNDTQVVEKRLGDYTAGFNQGWGQAMRWLREHNHVTVND